MPIAVIGNNFNNEYGIYMESERERERKKKEIFKQVNLLDGNDATAVAEVKNSILDISKHDLEEIRQRGDLPANELGKNVSTSRSSEVQLQDKRSNLLGSNTSTSSLMKEKLINNNNNNNSDNNSI